MSGREAACSAAWAAWLLLTSTSCSLVDLSSRINQASCHYDAECEILNTTDNPSFDVCEPFYCSARHFCEPARSDADHDGFSRDCETDPLKWDCDDFDPMTHPHAMETCDNRDNDCDMRIDEGALVSEQSVVLDFGDAKPSSDIVYAPGLVSRMMLGYAFGPAPSVIRFTWFDTQAATAQNMPPLAFGPPTYSPLHAESVVLSAVSGLSNVIAAYSIDEPQRMMVGNLDGTRSVVATGPSGVYGLSCAPDEACAANSGRPVSPVAAPFSETPTLAAGPDGILIAYLRNPDRAAGVCQSSEPIAKRILANLLVNSGPGMAISERTQLAAELGLSADDESPALLGITATSTNGQAYGWLMAYPDPRGRLLVVHVAFDGHVLTASEPLLTLESEAGPFHAAQLAAGRSVEGHLSVGLAAERGCDAASQIVFSQLEVLLESNAGLTLKGSTALAELGGAEHQHAASLAYNDQRASWGLAYRDALGVRARLISAAGRPTGDAPYALDAEPSLAGPAPSTAITAELRSDPYSWFVVFSYAVAGMTSHVTRSTLHSCQTGSPQPEPSPPPAQPEQPPPLPLPLPAQAP